MPIEEAGLALFSNISIAFFFKVFFILFLFFNVVFSLVLYRQVHVMGRTLMTNLVPFFRFVSIIYIGLSLALLIIVLGVF